MTTTPNTDQVESRIMTDSNEGLVDTWTIESVSWGTLTCKCLVVPRHEIDADQDDDTTAIDLIGIDRGNVRRIDWRFDPICGRLNKEALEALEEWAEAPTTPDTVSQQLLAMVAAND